MLDKPNPREVSLRMRAIVRKLGGSVESIAHEMGMTRSRLSNAIVGYVNPRHETVYALQQLLPGVTLEWVYFGDDRLVPAKLARELAIFVEAFRQKLELPAVPQEPDPPAPRQASRAVPRSGARAIAAR